MESPSSPKLLCGAMARSEDRAEGGVVQSRFPSVLSYTPDDSARSEDNQRGSIDVLI